MFNSCFSRQVNKKSSVIYENCTCKSLCDKYVLRHPLTACLLPPYRHTKTVPRADCSILITASLHLRIINYKEKVNICTRLDIRWNRNTSLRSYYTLNFTRLKEKLYISYLNYYPRTFPFSLA